MCLSWRHFVRDNKIDITGFLGTKNNLPVMPSQYEIWLAYIARTQPVRPYPFSCGFS